MDTELAVLQAKILMLPHGLLEDGWIVKLRDRRLPAQCRLRKKEISLSLFYVQNNEWEPFLKNSVLHEIAHAKHPPVWTGRRWSKHHREWRRFFISIGGNGERCCSPDAVLKEIKPRERIAKYTATCSCGITRKKYRKSKYMQFYQCRMCGERLVYLPINPKFKELKEN